MDIAGLVNLATQMSQQRTAASAEMLMLKKAMDVQKSTATQLIASVTPSESLPAHLGQNVNIVV